ncbi:MAG: hypothetical protein K5894_14590 [Lachnospiraceae bacterium]|nr:hypothetical protein [Lachnospiraceae bacterium]
MKNKKSNFFKKYIAFLIALCGLIAMCEYATRPNKPFYAEESNSKDVLFFGTSFCYCTYDPAIFSEYGIESYNMGKAQQPIIWTYYMMKDALKHQRPSLIILDPYAVTYPDKKMDSIDQGIANTNFDSMKYSAISLEGAKENVPWNRFLEFVFPIIRWHSNPYMIDRVGKDQVRDPERGYIRFIDAGEAGRPSESDLADEEIELLDDISYKYLNAMYDLSVETGAELAVIRSPFPLWGNHQFNAVQQWAKEKNVEYLDLTHFHDEIGIDYSKDTLDGNHLNESGADKVSRYIASWMIENNKLISER